MEKKAMPHEEVTEEESDSDCNADSKPSSTLGIEHVIKADVSKFEIKKDKQDLIDLVGLEVIEKMYIRKRSYNPEEVMDAYPKRIGSGWTTIYTQMRQRLDALHKAEADLKNADDLHDYFKSTKRYRKSVQFCDFQALTILNEPSLGMILFNSKQRQDFISIEDFEELNNEMLCNVQEIFFILHQGPRQDDL
ncbi:hypothetical protein Tco_0699651 [Tanacetum coccineum]